MAMSQQASTRLTRGVGAAVLFVLIIWTLAPLYWMVVTSLKVNSEIYGEQVTLWPLKPTFENYRVLFDETNFLIYFRNSVIVAVATTSLSLVCAALGAYALTRLHFPGRRFFARILVYSYLMPSSLLFIPLLIIVRGIGLQNTLEGLVFSYLGFTVPFCTWLLMGYFMSIPIELEESAMVDGCGRLGVLFRIVIPLTVPALAVVAFFSFTLSWNEFIYAMAFIQSGANKTVPVAILTELVTGDFYQWGALMAGSLLGSLPVALFYSLFVDYYVSSLTGAVKE